MDNLSFGYELPNNESLEEIDTIVFSISKQEIKSKNIDRIKDLTLKLTSMKTNARGKLLLTVSGYDFEEREIYQIPEVREYMMKIINDCPYFIYFLTTEEYCANIFIFCILNIISNIDHRTGEMCVSVDTKSTIVKAINKTLKAYCSAIGEQNPPSIEGYLQGNPYEYENNEMLSQDEFSKIMSYYKRLELAHPSIIPFIQNDTAEIRDYQGQLPDDLFFHHYYIQDTGHAIMAIPKSLLNKAIEDNNFDDYEVAIPVKYVLENGYEIFETDNRIINKRVIVDLQYDNKLGALVDSKYYEFENN